MSQPLSETIRKAKTPKKKIKRAVSLAMVKGRAKKGIKRSKIEELVEKWLLDAGIDVRAQHQISRIHVDLAVFGKEYSLALEVQGCYWHCCRKCYSGKITSKQLKKRQKDAKRFLFLHRAGWKVIPIWEHDILSYPEETRKQLIDQIISYTG